MRHIRAQEDGPEEEARFRPAGKCCAQKAVGCCGMRGQASEENRKREQKHTYCRIFLLDLAADTAYNCPSGTPLPERGRAGRTLRMSEELLWRFY